MNERKIKGHSGCAQNVVESPDGRLLVEKGCEESYIERLKKQQEKQQETHQLVVNGTYKDISVPSSEWKDNKILMDYIHSMSFVEYFERAAINDLKKLTNILINYIDTELSLSEIKTIEKDKFIKKIESVQETCGHNELVDVKKVNKYFTLCKAKVLSYDEINIPIGVCHGDLTFSNMLFTDSGMYLIDFLDSFVETPLQDIVKIRQDSKYGWSTMMTDQKYNIVHVKMVLNYIDNCISSYFEKYDFYKYYDMLQYINILRILPYVKEQKVYERICEILDSIKL